MIYSSGSITYSELAQKLTFEIMDNHFAQGDNSIETELEERIYLACKYLKLAGIITSNSEGSLVLTLTGQELMDKCLEENTGHKDKLRKYLSETDIRLDPMIVPLNDFLKAKNQAKVARSINSFYCYVDPEIQEFVRNKMISFEDKSICRSFLIIDEQNSDDEHFFILGFFSLALKILYVDQDKLSRKQKKDMNILSDQDGIPSYFIAQIGKNDIFKYHFEGRQIMDEALKMVYDCVGILGGTIVWLEANKGADYVINFYNEYGFDELMSESQDDGIERLQLVKYLNKE